MKSKSIASLLLMGCMCLMTACGNNQAASSNQTVTTAKSEVAETVNAAETEQVESSASNAEMTETETSATETSEAAKGTDILVVYFSATGNTKAIAENIANGLSADIYEIIAEEPYTAEDLNYNDNNSRSTIEMNDLSVRPAIAGSIDNLDQYDTIYIGYPIWWGEAPRIMDTFVESHDLSDKTVIPFCTSGSSGIGSSAKNLEKVAGNGNWMDGKRFSGSETQDEIMKWVNSL